MCFFPFWIFSVSNRIAFHSFSFDVSLTKCSLLYIIYSRQMSLIIVGKSRRCRFCISFYFLCFCFLLCIAVFHLNFGFSSSFSSTSSSSFDSNVFPTFSSGTYNERNKETCQLRLIAKRWVGFKITFGKMCETRRLNRPAVWVDSDAAVIIPNRYINKGQQNF